MIHIIDNGAPYSDHAIYFVETKTYAEASLLDRFLAMSTADGYRSEFKRIACAPEITWFEGEPIQFARFCSRNAGYLNLWPYVNAEDKKLIEEFVHAWIEAEMPEPAPEF